MMLFVFILVLQLVIAAVVAFVLKRLLDRELEKAAIEKFSSLKPMQGVKTITVNYASPLPSSVEQELTALAKRKFVDSKITFEQEATLKGGLIIKVADEILDFSLANRLEHFWS